MTGPACGLRRSDHPGSSAPVCSSVCSSLIALAFRYGRLASGQFAAAFASAAAEFPVRSERFRFIRHRRRCELLPAACAKSDCPFERDRGMTNCSLPDMLFQYGPFCPGKGHSGTFSSFMARFQYASGMLFQSRIPVDCA